jgi:[acyl-carrier-protein] S-malonyltransferase
MGFALIFSGQGMQHPAMLPWLTEDESLQTVERALGRDWRERLEDPAWAGRNAHAQLLLTALGVAAWSQLAPALPEPAVIAGYSVGELAAFSAGGVFPPRDAIALAQHRAALMDRDADKCATGLMAISGLAQKALERLCAEFGLALAIRNDPASVVVGGVKAALMPAAESAQGLGGHVTLLNVHVASHTPWMADAAKAFDDVLANAPFAFASPRSTLLSDFTGRIRDGAHAKLALAAQIDHTVRWDECMEGIAARGVRCVLEIGPGQALARMWNQQYPDIPARSADEFRTARGVIDWVERHAA